MPISLISLAAMGTIQKNISTKVRPVGLHKYKGVRICAAIYEKGLWITFTKAYRKQGNRNWYNLCAIDFHSHGPSSISTSKVSHVAENRNLFGAKRQLVSLTSWWTVGTWASSLFSSNENKRRNSLEDTFSNVSIKKFLIVVLWG